LKVNTTKHAKQQSYRDTVFQSITMTLTSRHAAVSERDVRSRTTETQTRRKLTLQFNAKQCK